MDFKIQSKIVSENRNGASLFEVGVIAIVIVLLGFFVVKPKYAATKVKADELKTAQAQFQKVEDDQKTMEKLISDMNNSKDEIALADQAMPLTGRITSLDLLLDNLVTTAGMKLASITDDEGDVAVVAGDKKLLDNPYGADRKLQTSQVNVTVTGPVEQFAQLLRSIETSSRLMDVDSISISKVDSDGQIPQITYKFRVKAYFYAPNYDKPKDNTNE